MPPKQKVIANSSNKVIRSLNQRYVINATTKGKLFVMIWNIAKGIYLTDRVTVMKQNVPAKPRTISGTIWSLSILSKKFYLERQTMKDDAIIIDELRTRLISTTDNPSFTYRSFIKVCIKA